MSIMEHLFGSTDVTLTAVEEKLATCRAELAAEHLKWSDAATLLASPSMLDDSDHAAAETAQAAAKRAVARLSDAIEQLSAARDAISERDARGRENDEREAFRREAGALAGRSAELSRRIEVGYPKAATALADIFGEIRSVRAAIATVTAKGLAIGDPVDIVDPEAFRADETGPGRFLGRLEQDVRLPGLRFADPAFFPSAA